MKKVFWINCVMYTALLFILTTDCIRYESPGKIPSCSTQAATNVLSQCVTLNGTVTDDGYYGATAVFEYGTTTSYGSYANPFQYTHTTGITNIFADITGLTAETTYHFRVKATNIIGTVYGDDMSFTTSPAPADHTGEKGTVEDRDGNIYQTIGIGSQIWMAENLKTTRYRNGDLIGTTAPATLDISGETTPRYQWAYDGNESNVATYGRLYTWYATTDSRNVCPEGWHVPSDSEWTILTDYLFINCYGYTSTVRTGIAKSLAATDWHLGYSSSSGNNSSGFTALPSGYRENTNRKFYGISLDCSWWSSTESSMTDANYRSMTYQNYLVSSYRDNKQLGFSVRCLKDN